MGQFGKEGLDFGAIDRSWRAVPHPNGEPPKNKDQDRCAARDMSQHQRIEGRSRIVVARMCRAGG